MIDPLVAVVLGITMLGEGGATTVGIAAGLVGLAALGLGAALLLARSHPEARQPYDVRARRSTSPARSSICSPGSCATPAGS